MKKARVELVKYVCKDEEGRKWEEEHVGYFSSLENALEYVRKKGHTDLTVMGFELGKSHDSRHFTYKLKDVDNPEMSFLD